MASCREGLKYTCIYQSTQKRLCILSENTSLRMFWHLMVGWKAPFHISLKIVSGKDNFCTWTKTTLRTILVNDKLDQIHNADEFGQNEFFQNHQDTSVHFKKKKKSFLDGKHSKVSINDLPAMNALGDKLPMFVIRKYKMPCCFIGLKHLVFHYRNQKKSFIGSLMFEE